MKWCEKHVRNSMDWGLRIQNISLREFFPDGVMVNKNFNAVDLRLGD